MQEGLTFYQTVAYLIGDAVYNLFFSPLACIPGPKLWAISRIPSQLSVLRGRNHIDIGALHAQYGPTVRIGPNEVTFSTAQAFRDIYLLRPGGRLFTKPRSHSPLPINGVDSMASAVDEDIHARQKKVFSAAFAPRALKEQEGLIQAYVNTMIGKLKGEIQQSPTQDGIAKVDICKWTNYTTFDILGDLIFGESFGCLEDGTLHPWIALLFGSARDIVIMIIINQFPMLGWFVRLLIPRSLRQKERDHFNLAVEKVERRLQLGTDRPDFVSTILKYGLSDVKDGKTLDRDNLAITRAELDSNAFL
jgi:cytochrome P450